MKIICKTEYKIGENGIGRCNLEVDLDHIETDINGGACWVGYCSKCGQGYSKRVKPLIEIE